MQKVGGGGIAGSAVPDAPTRQPSGAEAGRLTLDQTPAVDL